MAFSTTRKEDLSLKLRTQNMKNTKHITKQLEMESQKMEDRLNELRLAMNREKEERETQGGGFWGSGQTGSLNTYAKDVLNNKTAGTNKANREKAANKKNKVKVLKDEPIVVPERKKVIGNMANIAQRDPDAKVKGPKCGQCETKGAHVSCRECGEDYCASCFAAFHMKGALKKHRSAPLGSGNVRRTFSPMPTPRNNNTVMVNTGRLDSPASQSSSSHSANSVSSDRQISVYHNGESKVAQENSLLDGEYNEQANADDFRKALEEWRQNNKKPTEKLVAPDETALRRRRPSDIAREQILNNYQGPSLWEGNYSETESAASFQDALKDWRTGGTSADSNTKLQSASKTQVANTDSSTSTMNPKEPELNIHFTQSLTYAEKLLLKKHRRTELDAIPDSRVSSSYSGISPNSRTATSTDFDDEPYSSRLGFSDGLSSTRPTSSASTYVGPTSAMSSDSRTESQLTITDVDESKMSRRALRGIEQTSSYQVQESPSVTAHRQTPDLHNQEKSPPSRLSHSPVTRNSPSPAPPSKKPATPTARRPHRNIRSPAKIERTAVEEIEPRSLLSRPSSSASDIVSSLATKREEEFHVAPRNNRYRDLFQTKPSDELDWDKACQDKAKGASKPISARSKSKLGGTPRGSSSRASSRASTRATSRAASRAYSRISMFGEGVLTKKPSDALNHVARLADLLPRPQPVDDAMGLSDFFMAGVKKPFEERVVTPRITSARKTPRPASGRSSQQTMEKWKVSNKTYQMAPRSWRPDSSLGDVIPDHQVAAVLDTAAQDFSAFNTTATETDPELERESTLTFSLSRQNTENLNPTASHGFPTNSAAQTQTSQKSRPPSVSKRTSAMTPRIKTPLLDPLRSQTPRTRPGTPRSRAPTPRLTTPLVAAAEAIPERPSSRAIVPDGDDLSRFDEAGEVEEREKDDDHTLDALEWELASQEGRITADGKISRMSMMEDDILEDQEEMEEEKNWDVGKHLRESVLMDDFDDMEDQMMQEEEVKALH